jgi:hypothetical protein
MYVCTCAFINMRTEGCITCVYLEECIINQSRSNHLHCCLQGLISLSLVPPRAAQANNRMYQSSEADGDQEDQRNELGLPANIKAVYV